MNSITLQHHRLTLVEEQKQTTYYGFDQEWYAKKWHRMAGCGPTTAAQIVFYLQQAKSLFGPPLQWTKKEDSRQLMDVLWNYVTPGMNGVHKPEMLADGLKKFAFDRGVDLQPHILYITKPKAERVALSQVAFFIQMGLQQDIPVAFLNWHQGTCNILDSWHWVMVTGIHYDESEGLLLADIADAGEHKQVNLGIWRETSKLGGAFVRFELDEQLLNP